MIVLSLLILFLLGWSVINFISAEFTLPEKISFSFLAGITFISLIMFLLDLFGIPITLVSVYVFALVITAAAAALTFRKQVDYFKQLSKPKFTFKDVNIAWIVFAAAIGYVVYGVTVKNLYWPTTAFDSVAGYDLMAKAITNEGAIRNSLFGTDGTAISGSAHRIIYPPMVSGSFVYVYLSGLELPKLAITLYFVPFVFAFYFLIRKFINPTAAIFALFFTVFVPEMVAHAALSLINLPQAVFASLGLLCVYIWYDKRDFKYLLLGALMLAANTFTRTDGIFFNGTAFLLVLFYAIKNKTYKELIYFTLIAFSTFVVWNLYLKIFGIKAAVPNQQLLIPYPFWDADKFADWFGNIKYILLHPVYYGITIYLITAALLVNIPNIIKKDMLPFLFLTFFTFAAYTFLFYQIDYSWDAMQNVISYSYKRGMFAFMPLFIFYVFANRYSKILFDKYEQIIFNK